jgi:magnesium transporter
MELQDRKEITENLAYLIDAQDDPKVRNIIVDIHPADLADIIRDLESDKQEYLFNLIQPRTAADVIMELDEVSRDELIEDLGLNRLAAIADHMDSDDATDFLSELPAELSRRVLARMNKEDRSEVEKLIIHDEDTAGGIMALEFIAVHDDETVDDAIGEIRDKAQEVEDIFNIYVVNREEQLVGVLSLKRLLLSKRNMLIRDIMNQEVVSVTAEKDQEEVANIVRRYDLVAVPVVDKNNRLVGRITIDDVLDVLHEEANEDLQIMAGIAEEEIPQEMSTFKISRFRMPWLLVGFVGEIASAFIMKSFSASLEQIVATAFFIPLMMAMGGNSGIQASTIVVRSISQSEGGTTKSAQRIFREIKVALLNGLIMACLVFIMVFTFFTQETLFALVVSSAMLIVMVNAAVIGSAIPYLLNRLHFDPAIATGPFITTANDVVGLSIYLGMSVLYLQAVT